ncbi:MAG: SpoIID/LytB domain-containing protein [bacterium]
MPKNKRNFLTAFCCLLFASYSPAKNSVTAAIRILYGVSSVNISSAKQFKVFDMKDNRTGNLAGGKYHAVLPSADGLKIGGMNFSNAVKFTGGKEFIKVNGRSYRGAVAVRAEKKKLSVINEVEVEDYLFGVLPSEVSPKWDKEALKAQAVVSRTYVLRNLGRFASDGYDLTACDASQVYGGAGTEKPATTSAVLETEGEVLTYKKEVASVYFHADAAGHTENPACVWGSKTPPRYLKGVREPPMAETPYSDWEAEVTRDEIIKLLKKNGYSLNTIKRISSRGKTRSGRVEEFVVYTEKGRIKIASNKFRSILGTSRLRSTKITRIENKRKSVVFHGSGWGHGVGLSQWGAKCLAEKGWNYRKILMFYFPGTRLEKSK